LLLPVLFLLLLELCLRILGYGHEIGLFITDPDDKNAWVMNSHASEKFFSNTTDATVGNSEKFSKEKAPGTLRIFVLGESTTIGYPYMHNGSFHRMLQYRLLREYPQLNTEIINLSLTAVNSYTVLDFAKQVAACEPDAVFIYCGHNEYYGAMGVASTNAVNGNPLFIRTLFALRGSRVWQLLNNAYHTMFSRKAATKMQEENLMERMAGKQQVPYQSELYKKGIAQFEHNMQEVCTIFSGKNIPVFMSNLVSNEKDLAPFISTPGKDGAADYFQQAKQTYHNGDYTIAKSLFSKASELDLLKFRAPDEMNKTIAMLCKKNKGIHLVDTKQLFVHSSAGGILGNETLLEHVHPNLYGYALLSEAFYQAIKTQHLLPANSNNAMRFEQLRNELPVTMVDSIKGAFEIAALKMRWPFHDSVKPLPVQSFEARLASKLLTKELSWNNMLDTLMPYYLQHRNYVEALKVAESALLEYPHNTTFYLFAANCSKQLKDTGRLVLYLGKAFQLSASPALAKQLVDAHLASDDPAGAMPYLDYLITNTRAADMIAVKKMLTETVAYKKVLDSSFSKTIALQVAEVYRKLGYDAVAGKYNAMKKL